MQGSNLRPSDQVSDGMGGLKQGEIASKEVVTNLSNDFVKIQKIDESRIKESILNSHNCLIETSLRNHGYPCMGCTICLLSISNENYYVANVGDTRCYLFRDNSWSQLSVDDLISPDEINILSQCIGGNGESFPKAHINKGRVKLSDVFLIISDGIYRYVELPNHLIDNCSLEKIPKLLADQALKNGSTDDRSCILVTF